MLLSPHSTPPAARSELKKLLAARNVRKTIADPIMNRIFSDPVQPTAAVENNDGGVTSNGLAGESAGTATPVGEDVSVVHVRPPISNAATRQAEPRDCEP
jgi:CLIP-associating protein 1/2